MLCRYWGWTTLTWSWKLLHSDNLPSEHTQHTMKQNRGFSLKVLKTAQRGRLRLTLSSRKMTKRGASPSLQGTPPLLQRKNNRHRAREAAVPHRKTAARSLPRHPLGTPRPPALTCGRLAHPGRGAAPHAPRGRPRSPGQDGPGGALRSPAGRPRGSAAAAAILGPATPRGARPGRGAKYREGWGLSRERGVERGWGGGG